MSNLETQRGWSLAESGPQVVPAWDQPKQKQMWPADVAMGRLPGQGTGTWGVGGMVCNLTLVGSHHPCSLQTQNVQLNKEMTLASNRSLAEGNLLYQPQLDALKARLTQKYQELQVLFEAYQIKKTKLGNFFWVILQ